MLRIFTTVGAVTMCLAAAVQASVVTSTSGLIYHLDAASANVVRDGTNHVSAWNDASGAGRHFTQATADKQPTWISSSASFNNRPVISFDGDRTNLGITAPLADRLVLASSTAPRTVFIVNRTFATFGNDGIWGLNNADNGIRRATSSAWAHPGNTNDFTNTGSMFINGVATNLASHNTPVILTAITGGSPTFSGTALGEYFYNGSHPARPWRGEIAEVIAYDRVLTISERQAIENYLGVKYGFAFAIPEPLTAAPLAGLALLLLARRRR